MTIAITLAFAAGFCLALQLVGYGVRGGMRQIVALARYRAGRCQCVLCREAP